MSREGRSEVARECREDKVRECREDKARECREDKLWEERRSEANGRIALTFRRGEDGRTRMARQYFKLPLQILRPHYYDTDGTAIVYSLNPAGGILQHDRLLTEIESESGSSAVFTTPGNNKYYKMDDGCAKVWNRITVRDGAVLEYLPEHNVPFAKATVYQDNEFRVEKGGILFAADMVTPGRVGSGESFEYDRYSSRTRIYIDGELALYDNCCLEPEREDIQGRGLLDGYMSSGSLYVVCRDMDPTLKSRIDSMKTEGVRLGAGNVRPDLLVIRFLGDDMPAMVETLQKVWGECRRTILDKPALRLRKEFSSCSE